MTIKESIKEEFRKLRTELELYWNSGAVKGKYLKKKRDKKLKELRGGKKDEEDK